MGEDSAIRTAEVVRDFVGMVARPTYGGDQVERRPVRFAEFRQIVRRHRPSQLLPALAELAVRDEPRGSPTFLTVCPPWAVALAARESILWGNEFRHGHLDENDLRVLFNAHNDLDDGDAFGVARDVLGLLTRVAFEQFPYGESAFEEVARSHAMLVDHPTDLGLEVLGDSRAWERMLGTDLGLAVGATFLLQVAANQNAGWFDPQWLDQANFAEVLERWPRSVIERRLTDLSSTFAAFKADYESMPKPPNASRGMPITL